MVSPDLRITAYNGCPHCIVKFGRETGGTEMYAALVQFGTQPVVIQHAFTRIVQDLSGPYLFLENKMSVWKLHLTL